MQGPGSNSGQHKKKKKTYFAASFFHLFANITTNQRLDKKKLINVGWRKFDICIIIGKLYCTYHFVSLFNFLD